MKANKQIWRMAKWLSEEINSPVVPWEECSQDYKNDCYDTVKKFLYMLAYNAFTGEDNHEN